MNPIRYIKREVDYRMYGFLSGSDYEAKLDKWVTRTAMVISAAILGATIMMGGCEMPSLERHNEPSQLELTLDQDYSIQKDATAVAGV